MRLPPSFPAIKGWRAPRGQRNPGRSPLQVSKTREQQLREFELWLVVEKKLAEGRVAAAKTKNGSEQNAHPQKGGKSRDLAAERVGLGAGDKAEAALKALKAADAAEASGDSPDSGVAHLLESQRPRSQLCQFTPA